MRIGFFGNTANFPFMLAQAMRQLDNEVILVVDREELLYRPESHYPEFRAGYPDWIIDGSRVSEREYRFLDAKVAPFMEALAACDALVLNGLGPSLLPLLGRPALSLLTGSDLDYYASLGTIAAVSRTWDPAYKRSITGQWELRLMENFIRRQQRGIRDSVAVHYMPRGMIRKGDELLDQIGVPDSRRIFIQIAEVERIKPSPPPQNRPVRVFCPTRITWKLPIDEWRSSLDYKGSDVMISGLGLFFRQTGERLDIRLVRKGLHVTELQALIDEEGLKEQVTWLDEMPQSAVWEEFARCDIVFEQLAQSVIGMVGMDAMASARPVIGNARAELLSRAGLPIPPVCQAATPAEVCAQLQRLAHDPAERERIGLASRQHVERFHSPERVARFCLGLLQQAVADDNARPHWLRGALELHHDLDALARGLLNWSPELQQRSSEVELRSAEEEQRSAEIERQSAEVEQRSVELAQLNARETERWSLEVERLQTREAEVRAREAEVQARIDWYNSLIQVRLWRAVRRWLRF